MAPTEKPKSQNGETAKHQKKPEKINGFKSGSDAVSPVKSSEKQEAKSQTQKTAKPVANEKKDGGRLKSMFATAASKPKPKPKEKETEKSKPVGNKAVTCFPPERESSGNITFCILTLLIGSLTYELVCRGQIFQM